VKVRIKDNQPSFEIISAPPKAGRKKGKKSGEAEPQGEQGQSEAGQPEEQA
jgi:hypothetical protein